MAKLSEKVTKLVEGKNFATIATIMPDGSPQATVVWVDHDGEHLIVNTAESRKKFKNIQSDKRVALTIFDTANPYNSVSIRGEVTEIIPDKNEAHINKMAKKYIGMDKYPNLQPGEKRVILKITPKKIIEMG